MRGILLLTSVFDFSADLVALRLHENGVPYLRLNKEHLKDYRLSLDPVEQSLSIDIGDGSGPVQMHPEAVWFRQPVFLRNSPSKPLTLDEQLARSQWTAFLRSLCTFDSARWMNWPQATYLAECKPYQLLVAKRCGLKVPLTRITNDARQIQLDFAEPLVLKSLDTVLLREHGDCLFTYTTSATIGDFDDSTLYMAPVMVQSHVQGKTDCRVTVVGEQVFAVRILVEGNPATGDWRTESKERLQYEDFRLTPEIEEKCLQLTHGLGLSFGGIDLLETRDGYYFLEINPTGEWGWLCNDQRPIDQAIASWLSAA